MAKTRKKQRNVFAGADDVYLTKKHIAVRKINTYRTKDGKAKYSDKTKYYKRTTKNMNLVQRIFGRVRFGR